MLLAVASVGIIGTAGSCGGAAAPAATKAGAIETSNPVPTFAPRIDSPSNERYQPMSVRWFLDHAVLTLAEDQGCPDGRIAVGRALPERRTEVTNWIFPVALGDRDGGGFIYYRNPQDSRCELNFDVRVYANDLTRPHDPGLRAEGLRPGEGFYLDLVDEARGGPDTLSATPIYGERTDEGDAGVRLTYWMLYGMNDPPGRPGETHEGDWERVDILLRDEGDNHYVPQALQLEAGTDDHRELAWSTVLHVGGTHPVVTSAPGSHALSADVPDERCGECFYWRTWHNLVDAGDQPWYGFGGAWGQAGATSATTGPLGPHGSWPTAEERARELAGS